MAIINPPIQESSIKIDNINQWLPQRSSISIDLLRLDLIHPIISGNKWFKLKLNIAAAKNANHDTILTYGGAYSNHLIATAAAAQLHGLKAIGIVRGDELHASSNHVLQMCSDLGMSLQFVTRNQYERKDTPEHTLQITSNNPNYYIIPEGGKNKLGIEGAANITQWIPSSYTHIVLSVGTSTTYSGILSTTPPQQHLIGLVPIKGGAYLKETIQAHNPNSSNWQLFDTFHFGGFGKYNQEVKDCIQWFSEQYNILLDPIYTSKMLLGVKNLAENGFFPQNAKVLCIHTGGMTGN